MPSTKGVCQTARLLRRYNSLDEARARDAGEAMGITTVAEGAEAAAPSSRRSPTSLSPPVRATGASWAVPFFPALISLATSAHQGWSANLFTLVSDIFPKQYVGSVVGIGGAAGALGGAIFARVAGHTLQFLHGYAPLFIIAGILHPLALAVIHLLIPRIEPLES